MVNIDKLNKTIDDLDIKAKEIETIVQKQKEFEKLTIEVGDIKEKINIESKTIVENSSALNKMIKDSKKTVEDIDKIIDSKFIELSGKLEGNNNKVAEILKNNQKISEDKVENQNKKISKMSILVEKVEDNVKVLDSNILKKLNDITAENYKAINEFQNALESKIGLLKSDISLEIRNLENRQEISLDSKIEKINNEINIVKDSVIKFQEESKVIFEKTMKKNQIMLVVITVLIVVAIIVGIVK